MESDGMLRKLVRNYKKCRNMEKTWKFPLKYTLIANILGPKAEAPCFHFTPSGCGFLLFFLKKMPNHRASPNRKKNIVSLRRVHSIPSGCNFEN